VFTLIRVQVPVYMGFSKHKFARIPIRLGVKATTSKAKAKDLTFKAKDLIPKDKVGYQNKY